MKYLININTVIPIIPIYIVEINMLEIKINKRSEQREKLVSWYFIIIKLSLFFKPSIWWKYVLIVVLVYSIL